MSVSNKAEDTVLSMLVKLSEPQDPAGALMSAQSCLLGEWPVTEAADEGLEFQMAALMDFEI